MSRPVPNATPHVIVQDGRMHLAIDLIDGRDMIVHTFRHSIAAKMIADWLADSDRRIGWPRTVADWTMAAADVDRCDDPNCTA